MKTFKQFILEYLTPSQEKKYSSVRMTDKARKDTDHFFGKKNDKIVEPLTSEPVNKSEVHKGIESHFGYEIAPEDYKAGYTYDKYGRKVKIGKLIKGNELAHRFENDSTRQAKSEHNLTVSIHRGIQVAGQTNSEPDHLHPSGHSWGQQSCKSIGGIKPGSNSRYLEGEVEHGSVVAFLHDKDGKEIARHTLQPYHNEKGEVIYGIDSHYGVNHKGFTDHVNDIANRLSSEAKDKTSMYKLHPEVYDNDSSLVKLHPDTDSDKITKILGDKNEHWTVRKAAIEHPNATKEHISQILGDKNVYWVIKRAALLNPNVTKEHISQILGDKNEHWMLRKNAIQHPKATKEHISQVLNDKNEYWEVRKAAINEKNKREHHKE